MGRLRTYGDEGQLDLPGVPEGWRRIYCRGNCGRWWYWRPRQRGGKPQERCERCAHLRELALKRTRRAKGIRRCWICDEPLPRYPGRGPKKTCAACAAGVPTQLCLTA